MAERFTNYRGGGIAHAQPRNIDFADLRESQKSSLAMADSADRMGSFFNKIADEQAAIEGAKYYAENPNTLKQLEDAKALGKDPEELFAGQWTTFDKAGRKVQMQQVASEIDLQARTELTSMLADIKLGKADLSSLTDMSSGSPRPGGKLADLVDGLSSVVKDAAPELYPTIRASLSQMANSTLSSAISEEATRTLKQKKVKGQKGVQSIIEATPQIIARGDMVDPTTGKTITVDQQLDVLRQSIDNYSVYANDPTMQKSGREDFNKAVTTARKAALEDWADQHPEGITAALAQAKAGKFDSPAMQNAYDALPEDQQLDVRGAMRKLRSERIADKNAERAARTAAREDADLEAVDLFSQARRDGDLAGMQAAVASMSPKIRPAYEETVREHPTGFKAGDAVGLGELKRQITIGGAPTSDYFRKIDASLAAGKIVQTEATQLTELVMQQRDKSVIQAKSIISAKVRYDPQADTSGFGEKEKKDIARRKAIYETTIGDFNEALSLDPKMDVMKWVKDNLVEIEQRETERSLEAAREELERAENYLRSQNIDPTGDRNALGVISSQTKNTTHIFYINKILDTRTSIAIFERKLGVQR